MALQSILTDIHDDIEWAADRIETLENLGSYVGTQVYSSVPTNLSELQLGAGVNDFFTVDDGGNFYRYIITDITAPTFVSVQDIQYNSDVSNKVDKVAQYPPGPSQTIINHDGVAITIKTEGTTNNSAFYSDAMLAQMQATNPTSSGSVEVDAMGNQSTISYGGTKLIVDGATSKAYYGSVTAGNEIAKKSDISGAVDISNKVDKVLSNATNKTEIYNNTNNAVIKSTSVADENLWSRYQQDFERISILVEDLDGTNELILSPGMFQVTNTYSTFSVFGDFYSFYIDDGVDSFGVTINSGGMFGSAYKPPTSDSHYVQNKYITDNFVPIMKEYRLGPTDPLLGLSEIHNDGNAMQRSVSLVSAPSRTEELMTAGTYSIKSTSSTGTTNGRLTLEPNYAELKAGTDLAGARAYVGTSSIVLYSDYNNTNALTFNASGLNSNRYYTPTSENGFVQYKYINDRSGDATWIDLT